LVVASKEKRERKEKKEGKGKKRGHRHILVEALRKAKEGLFVFYLFMFLFCWFPPYVFELFYL